MPSLPPSSQSLSAPTEETQPTEELCLTPTNQTPADPTPLAPPETVLSVPEITKVSSITLPAQDGTPVSPAQPQPEDTETQEELPSVTSTPQIPPANSVVSSVLTVAAPTPPAQTEVEKNLMSAVFTLASSVNRPVTVNIGITVNRFQSAMIIVVLKITNTVADHSCQIN